MNALTEKALQRAISQIGVRETKRNRGPEVDAYLIAAGLDPTRGEYAWCCAFAYWSFRMAALDLGVKNPMTRTASGIHLWQSTPDHFKVKIPVPGALFVVDHGKGQSHVGFVEYVSGGHFDGPSGNSNPDGGREGYEVCRYPRRNDSALGFIDFSQPEPELVA